MSELDRKASEGIESDAETAVSTYLSMSTSEIIQALEASETRFHDIADRIEQGLWLRSPNGKQCLYLNPAFERIWGRTLADMNKIAWADTIHPEDVEEAYEYYLKHQDDGEDYTLTYRIVRPDGEIRWIENQGYAILAGDGHLMRMAGIARDITQQIKIDEELRLAQKLKSLGKLSSGIAHEINTPCQYVSDNITFVSESMAELTTLLKLFPDLLKLAHDNGAEDAEIKRIQTLYNDADLDYMLEEIPAALSQSSSGMTQIKKIVAAMKGFSHPGAEKVPTDINEVIRNAIIIASSEWKHVAAMLTELDDDLPLVNIIPSALSQVFINLISNAAHAFSESDHEAQTKQIVIKTFLKESLLIIKLSDNGSGIPKEIIEQIFDPFFTTKEVGEGTGQGLSIVHKIIHEDHEGTIIVESSTGSLPARGTCFTISLPLTT